MGMPKLRNVILSLGAAVLVLFSAATEVRAVPSFQRQTGQDCFACHTMFPELTPLGGLSS